MALVDVVIPSRNRLTLTLAAIQSVREQTFKDWRLIIVDDGSDDGSKDYLEKAVGGDERVQLVSQSHAGPAVARRRGVESGGSPWVALLDSDDLWLPQKLELQMKNATGRDVVLCWHQWVKPDGSIRVGRKPMGDGRVSAALSNNVSTPLIRREFLAEVGGIEPPSAISSVASCEHIEFMLRLLAPANVCVVPEFLVRCRDHAAPRESNLNTTIAGAEAMDAVLKYHEESVRAWPEDHAALLRSVALRLVAAGRSRRGYHRYLEALEIARPATRRAMAREDSLFLVRRFPALLLGLRKPPKRS